jgi:hypothetical protein
MKRAFRIQFFTLLLAAICALASCSDKRLTKANVAEVSEGMSPKQVESILGPPTAIDSTKLLPLKEITYTYQQGDESVTIVFTNDKVVSKENSLRE